MCKLITVNSLKDNIFQSPWISGDATPQFPLDSINMDGYTREQLIRPELETVHNTGILRSLRSSGGPGPHTLAPTAKQRGC